MGFCCCLVSCLCFFAVFVFCFFKSNTTYIWCFLESQFRLIYKTLKHWRTSDARIFALHIDEVWECLNLALRYWSLASMIRGSAVELFWMQPGSFGESAFKARIARWWKIWCSRQPVAHTLKKTENYIQYISCHRLALHSFSLQRACRIGELHCQSKTTWNDVLQVNENVPLKAPSAEASPQRCFVLMILMIQMREWLNLAFGTFGCWLVACFGLLANLFAGMCVCVCVSAPSRICSCFSLPNLRGLYRRFWYDEWYKFRLERKDSNLTNSLCHPMHLMWTGSWAKSGGMWTLAFSQAVPAGRIGTRAPLVLGLNPWLFSDHASEFLDH